MYEEVEVERVLAVTWDENGIPDDILFLNIFGESGIEGSLRGRGESCFKSFLLSEVMRCLL